MIKFIRFNLECHAPNLYFFNKKLCNFVIFIECHVQLFKRKIRIVDIFYIVDYYIFNRNNKKNCQPQKNIKLEK